MWNRLPRRHAEATFSVAIWDFLTGELKSVRNSVHVGEVRELCFASMNGEPVLVSGATDGMLRVWTPALDELLRIEIGEAITAWVMDLAAHGR
jgi:WD40 repeat protein